jgi:large subunit ribosomal protein L21
VERLGQPVGAEVSLEPVMVVDDKGAVVATKAALAKAAVRATVVGEETGPKINAGTYKAKANVRKRWGHRQHYSTIEITSIAL